MLLKKFAAGAQGLFASPDPPAPTAAAPAPAPPTAPSSWRDLDWIRRGTSALTRKRASATPALPSRASATPSIPPRAARQRLTLPAAASASSASAAQPQQRSISPAPAPIPASPSASHRASLASENSSGPQNEPHRQRQRQRHHSSLRPSEADDDDRASTHSTQSVRSSRQARGAPVPWAPSDNSARSSVRSSLNASRPAAYPAAALDLPLPTPLAPRGGKHRHANASPATMPGTVPPRASGDGSTTSSRPRGGHASARGARPRAGRTSTVPAPDDTTPRGSLDWDASTPESWPMSLASSSAHTSSRPASSSDKCPAEAGRGDTDAEHSPMPPPPPQTNNVRTRARARAQGLAPLTSSGGVSAGDQAACSTSAPTGHRRPAITHPSFGQSQHSLSPRSAGAPSGSSCSDGDDEISDVSKRLSRTLTHPAPVLNTADAGAAGDITLKPSASQQDSGLDGEQHTLSNQSSASTLAVRPRVGAMPLSTLQALAPSTAQTGSNFASRFKAAREQSSGLTPTPDRSGGAMLTEKSSVATLTASSMHTTSTADSLRAAPSTPGASSRNPVSSTVAPEGRALNTSKIPRSLLDDDGVRTMGVAVVGQRSVGKTSVIRRGLRQYGLSRPTVLSSTIRAYAIRCVLDQSAAENIRVLELDSAAFVAPTGTELAWPLELADPERLGHGKVDGAVICYDASYLPTLKGVPELLEFFHKAHIPTVVLACKSDIPAKAIDPYLVRELASKFGARVTECSVAPPPAGSAAIGEENKKRLRDTFHHLLRSMAQERVQRADLDLGYATATVRHRHHHASNRSTPASFPANQDKNHGKRRSRALASHFSLGGRVNLEDLPLGERERMQEEEQAAGPGPEAISISDFLASMDVTGPPTSSSSSESDDEGRVRVEPDPDVEAGGAESEDESRASTWSAASRRSSIDSAISSNLENEEDEVVPALMLRDVSIPSVPEQMGGVSVSLHNSSIDSSGNDIASSAAPSGAEDSHFPLASGRKKARAKEPVYVPLANLSERFFLSVVNMSDPEFLSAFLVFYRAFASPELLLSEFMAKFDALTEGGSDAADGTKGNPQQGLARLVTAFHDWVRQYPGDLSTAAAASITSELVEKIAQHPATSSMAQAIEHDVELCQSTIDLDVMWSVDASAALLSTPSSWDELGASESAAARHDAYRHFILLSASQPMKKDPSTESAKRALEALSPSGLSMLSPSSPAPSTRPSTGKPPPAATSVSGSESAVQGSASSSEPTSDGDAPTLDLAQALKATSSEAGSRACSASIQTSSSDQASVQGGRQAGLGPPEPVGSSAAGTSESVAKATDKQDGHLTEPRSSLRPVRSGGHPRSNTISSTSTTGRISVSAASVSSTASSSLGSIPVGTDHPSEKQVLTLRSVSNALLVVDEAALAEEMTRLEWALFSVIGPRDWLRHALVKPGHRVPHGRVAQSIAHFNYTSAWVVSVILAQAKIKARVRVMEKLIRLAVRLRMLNNYNSLYAVLAGLASSPIHRLKNTRAVVQEDKELHKRYLSLHRLMRPDRASSAYRLALENSSGRIIPFIGVHLHDILSSAEGNPSRRQADGAVHWRKFTLMNDAISTLTKAQKADSSPPVEHPDLVPLFMDVPILEEDAAYDMSLALEPKKTTSTAQNLFRKMQGS